MGMYSRNDMIESMKISMKSDSAGVPAGSDSGKSAKEATTAGAKASENKPSGALDGEGGDTGTGDDDKGGDSSGSDGDSDSNGGTASDDSSESGDEKALEGDEQDGDAAADEDPEAKDETESAAAEKLDDEEKKVLDAWGLKNFKPTEENRKLLKIARDNHSKVQEYQQQTAQSNDYLAAVGNVLVSHDVESLNDMIEQLGGDRLPFDLRTEEDQIQEVTDNFNAFYDALKAGLDPVDFAKAQKALAGVHGEASKKLTLLEKKVMTRQATDDAVKKLGGSPKKGQYLENLKKTADQNFDALNKADKNAETNMKILEPIFKLGTVLQNPSKAYAMAPKVVNELGEALDFKRNFKEKFLPVLQKEWEAAYKLKRMNKPPPSSSKSGGSGEVSPNTKNGNNQNTYAGKRLLEKFGSRRK